MQLKFVFSLVIFLVIRRVISIDKKNVEINCPSSMKSILNVLVRDESDTEVILKLFSPNSNSTRNKTDILNFKLGENSRLKNNGSSAVNGELYEFVCDTDGIGLHDEDGDLLETGSEVLKEVEQIYHNEIHTPLEILTPATLLAAVPPFDPRNTEGISEDCKRQTDIYFKDLKKLKLWALKMYDSSAKIPSGFLNGNINQYGDMDQCLSVRNEGSLVQGRGSIIRGKYCLSSLQLTISSNASSSVKEMFRLVHSHHSFRSELRDPGHRVPRFSSINWALCVPSGCSYQDVQKGIEQVLSGHVNGAAVTAEVLVEPQMCQVEREDSLPRGTVFVGSLFLGFIMLAVFATVMEINGKQSHELISSFSLRRNLKTLFSIRRSEDDVQAVHGIRCLNALMLLLSHKSMAIFFVPFINRTHMAESLGHSWSVVGRAASLYTDPFIMFSGLLTCYSFIGRANKRQELSILQEYLGRLFRLVPTLGALILFCTWVLPEMGSGPQWPLVISHHAHICKQHWWRNLLFVHNYFGFENMCLTHTHHIGIDTQLFAFGVPIALWLATRPNQLKKSVIILVALALLSTAARFYVSYTMELANFVYFGTSVSQLFRTANYMYILPAHRATVYIMGLLLGLLLRHKPVNRLTGFQLRLGWFSCMSLFLLAFLSPAGMGRMGYQYSALPAASYAAFTPIAWCMFFGWIVYTQHHGYNNFVGRIFCWKGFLIWTRLSYAVYLTQFPVFFYYVGITRNPGTYSFIGHMVDMKELIVVLFYSIVLTLLFDLPFQNIKKLVCKPKLKVTEGNKQQKDLPVTSNEIKFNSFGESIAIVERNSNKKLWKAD